MGGQNGRNNRDDWDCRLFGFGRLAHISICDKKELIFTSGKHYLEAISKMSFGSTRRRRTSLFVGALCQTIAARRMKSF